MKTCIFIVSLLRNGYTQITAQNKRGEIFGFVQIDPTERYDQKKLVRIEQLYVNENVRGQGLGSELASRAIKYALEHNKGIHLMIQPGSSLFWKSYFNARYKCKCLTFFGGVTLKSMLTDGKVIEISQKQLVANYKYPVEKNLRDNRMTALCLRSRI